MGTMLELGGQPPWLSDDHRSSSLRTSPSGRSPRRTWPRATGVASAFVAHISDQVLPSLIGLGGPFLESFTNGHADLDGLLRNRAQLLAEGGSDDDAECEPTGAGQYKFD